MWCLVRSGRDNAGFVPSALLPFERCCKRYSALRQQCSIETKARLPAASTRRHKNTAHLSILSVNSNNNNKTYDDSNYLKQNDKSTSGNIYYSTTMSSRFLQSVSKLKCIDPPVSISAAFIMLTTSSILMLDNS